MVEMVEDRIMARATRALAGTLQVGLVMTGLAFGTGVAPAQAAQGDSQLQSAVQTALAGDAQLRGQQITATVSQGAVTLSGAVADETQRVAAEQTVAQVTGVRSINDSISVGGQVAGQQNGPDQQNGAGLQDGSGQASGVAMPPADGNVGNEQASGEQAAGNQAAGNSGMPANMPPPPPADSVPQAGQYPPDNGQGNQYPPQQGQYPNRNYPPQQPGQYAPYPQQRGQYLRQPYAPAVAPEKQNASGPVTLAPGLLLNVRTSEPLSTARLKTGDFVQFTAASDVYANGVVAVPRGAVYTGQVVEAKNAGALGGSPRLDLKLTTVTLGSQSYPIAAEVWSSQGPSKTGYTAANTVGGAAFGALIGAIAGGGIGAGVGAVAGGATGAVVSGATHGPRLDLPAEALLQFHLTAPLTVQPVNYNEAQRLAASVPQQPVLRPRPGYMVAPYPYYARPYYGYPAPYYYRPY